MANYRYQPLDTRKQDIRLIRLKSAVPDISADCHIATFPIRTAPPYIALSYTWDSDDVPKTPIKIDDQELEIGQSVRDFLFHLEDPAIDVQQALYREFSVGMRCVWDLSLLRSRLAMPTRETWLWIDQICIDQASTVEKNHQVPLMSKIYSRCEFVISWLGARPLDLELIPNCRYFSRLWILQEILLAPFAFILCRKTWISMMDRNWRGTLSFDSSGLSRIHTLAPYFFPVHTLDWVLEKFAWNECKDPRDKVYGLLGLFNGRDHIPTDYAKSTAEIVCDVLHVTLNETNDPLSASLGKMPFRVPLGTAILAEQFGISATKMTQLWRDLEERKEFGLPFDVEYLQELARRLEIIEKQS